MDATSLATNGDYPAVIVDVPDFTAEMLRDGLAVADAIDELVAEPRESSRDLERLIVGLNALLERVSALRDRLDGWHALSAIQACSAADSLAAWRWERNYRASLVSMSARLQEALTAAKDAARGQTQKTALVRSGDSWQSLAQTHLGDWSRWPELVERNSGDPSGPVTGSEIRIPER